MDKEQGQEVLGKRKATYDVSMLHEDLAVALKQFNTAVIKAENKFIHQYV